MRASNTANVEHSDFLAKLNGELIRKAEMNTTGATIITLNELNQLYSGIARLTMVERHLHNITSGAYQ